MDNRVKFVKQSICKQADHYICTHERSGKDSNVLGKGVKWLRKIYDDVSLMFEVCQHWISLSVPSHTRFKMVRMVQFFDLSYTGSSLHPGSYHPRSHLYSNLPEKKVPVKCMFCQEAHWSDQRSVILNFEARK